MRLKPVYVAMSLALLLALSLAMLPALRTQESVTPAAVETASRDATGRMQAIRKALDDRHEALATAARDYAHWNDAYLFATGARSGFPGAALLPPALSALGIENLVVLDRGFETRLSVAISASPLGQTLVAADPQLVRALRTVVEAGSLRLPEQSWRSFRIADESLQLVVARSILRSANSEPGGWLVFTQRLERAELSAWRQQFVPEAMETDLTRLSPPQTTPAMRQWLANPSPDRFVYSEVQGTTLRTWIALHDVAGRPFWLAELRTPIVPVRRSAPPALLAALALAFGVALLAALAASGVRHWPSGAPARAVTDAKNHTLAATPTRGTDTDTDTDIELPAGSPREAALSGSAPADMLILYEPIIDLRTGGVWGLASRLRWRDEARGWIEPRDDVRVRTETGELLTSGRFMLQSVADDVHRWRVARARPGPVSVQFAVSVTSFDDARQGLQQWAANGQEGIESLQVELVVDSVLDSRTGRIYRDVLTMWRQLGLPIVVSRWGARRGVQPVPMLDGLDALKIDVRLVNEIDLFPAAREALRELVAQAVSLGMPVIAEGVEQWPQLRTLREVGCHLAQGPLFGKAVTASDVPHLLTPGAFHLAMQDPLEQTDKMPPLQRP